MNPQSHPDACRTLAEGVSFSRPEAQRAIGAQMLEALVSLGYAWEQGGRYAATDAGRRCAQSVPIEEPA